MSGCMGSLHTPVKNFSHFAVKLDDGISPTALFDLIFWVWQAIASVAC